MTERLKEVDEQCYFLKDTLYSILTTRGSSGIQVPLDWRLDWTGPDWTGLDWTELDWTGLD